MLKLMLCWCFPVDGLGFSAPRIEEVSVPRKNPKIPKIQPFVILQSVYYDLFPFSKTFILFFNAKKINLP